MSDYWKWTSNTKCSNVLSIFLRADEMCFFDKFGTLVEILHLRGSKTEHLVIRYIYTYMHIDAIGRDGAENPHHSVSMVFSLVKF